MTSLAITGPACLVADCASLNPVDFNRLKAARWNGIACEGVILRCTRSNGALDTDFAPRFGIARDLGFLVGAYDFNTGETAKVQADRFLSATASCGSILRALDYETNPSGAQMSLAACLEWLDRVDQATGRRAWLYSGYRIKSLILQATDSQRAFLAQRSVWVPQYGPSCVMLDDEHKPLPWSVPTLWQFTGDGQGPEPHTLDGLQQGADLSLFRGTRADLEALWCGNAIAPPAVAAAPAAPVTPHLTGFALWFDHLRNAV